jgi:hypothetical protein
MLSKAPLRFAAVPSADLEREAYLKTLSAKAEAVPTPPACRLSHRHKGSVVKSSRTCQGFSTTG